MIADSVLLVNVITQKSVFTGIDIKHVEPEDPGTDAFIQFLMLWDNQDRQLNFRLAVVPFPI